MNASRRRAAQFAAVFAAGVFVVVATVLWLLGMGWLAVIPAVLVAGLWVTLAWRMGDRAVLRLCSARPADLNEHARLLNITTGLCAAMGLPQPALYVIDDPARNALVVGRGARHASLVVTRGLLDSLSLVELEAVMALQLCRVRSGTIIAETLVVPTFGITAILSELVSEGSQRWEWVSRALAWPLPLVRWVIARLHPSSAEVDADISALAFTRYPPGLADGLVKMAGHSAIASAAPITEHLWIAPPLSPAATSPALKIHTSLSERIAVLREL